MIAFLKSDMFRNFMGGFVLGAIGIFSFQAAQARYEPAQTPGTVASAVPADRNGAL